MAKRRISPVHWALVSTMALAVGMAASHAARAADPPELAVWRRNVSGLTGYGGLPANIQTVRYSATSVYVNCTSIPSYSIGPWPGNPNTPTNQDFLLRFPRSPVVNAGTKTSTPLGTVGVWTNGVSIFNALDAHSYLNQNIWHQNAVTVEGPSFDACLGHPAPGGNYHNHENASCLYGADSTRHSQLLGFAFDGFPVYGPYGYANTDGTGGITRIRSSYGVRNIVVRQVLPDGTVLTPSQYGPAVSANYPLGYYVEDYAHIAGLGDLDEFNGRFAVTPEYPGGTYAYYVTVDATGAAVYPYDIGPSYYGVVATDDITSHGHVTISEPVTAWTPTTGVGGAAPGANVLTLAQNQPNPAVARSTIRFELPRAGKVRLELYDLNGHRVATLVEGMRAAGAHDVTLDTAKLAAGVYFYELRAGAWTQSRHLVVVR